MSAASLVALRCRISDRDAGPMRGVDALAGPLGERLGAAPRPIGTPAEPRAAPWGDDLAEARGCLLEAGGQVDDALAAGRLPVLLASDCAIGLTTLPAVARHRPDARFLWLDAHGDFNTPGTTASGFLGGMALAGACGLWDAGLAEPVDPARVVLAGARDLDGPEREALERSEVTVIGASLETLVYTQNALDRAPVFVHLDLDVLDPEFFPAWMPAPGGLSPDKLYDLLEAVAGECEVIGVEVTDAHAPEDEGQARAMVATAMHVLEPLVAAVTPWVGGNRLY
ncbi:MAG: arginase family protein [Thermoleophilaceae bacterium]